MSFLPASAAISLQAWSSSLLSAVFGSDDERYSREGAGSPSLRLPAEMSTLSATVSSPCNALSTYPNTVNIHEFTAGPRGAVFLDVIFPPYDSDSDRQCNYYAAIAARESMEDSTNDDAGGCTVMLETIEEPDDFRCQNGVIDPSQSPRRRRRRRLKSMTTKLGS